MDVSSTTMENWLVKSASMQHLVRLPDGICCGLCGLIVETTSDGEYDAELVARKWREMEDHVKTQHCAACAKCGAPGAGTIELSTGEVAWWVKRSRTRSPLNAVRAYRREANARTQTAQRRPFLGGGGGTTRTTTPLSDTTEPLMSRTQRLASPGARCGHCFCENCARETAMETLSSSTEPVRCPATDGCTATVERKVLGLFLAPEQSLLLEPTFTCVACGDERPCRDKVPLHDPDRLAPRLRRFNRTDFFPETRDRMLFGTPNRLPPSPPAAPATPPPTTTTSGTTTTTTLDTQRSPTSTRKRRRVERRGDWASLFPDSGGEPPQQQDPTPSSCELCAPCAKRWLEIQARDGVAYVRCPTPKCRVPLSRETLELLLSPDAYQALLRRARTSFEARLRELQSSAKTVAFETAKSAMDQAKASLEEEKKEDEKDEDDGTLAFLKWAGDATRACPECHVIIYRSEGCSHISCACGAEFNWDWAERIDGRGATNPRQTTATVPTPFDFSQDVPPAPAPPTSSTMNVTWDRTESPAQLRRALDIERTRALALQHEIDRLHRRFPLSRSPVVPVSTPPVTSPPPAPPTSPPTTTTAAPATTPTTDTT